MKKKRLFPEKGSNATGLVARIQECKSGDARWEQGKVFGFVYHPGSYYAAVSEAYQQAFMYDSTLNPTTFPSLRNFERDIVGMAAELMHGTRGVTGSVTTGGTESIFLALKVAREFARERSGENSCEVILPETIHPAFLKACEYLSLKAVMVPVGEDQRADPESIQRAVTSRSALICCSAPCFPYGVVDPVSSIGQVAKKNNLLLHVDACMGGFMLPFLEEAGYVVPRFDFRVPGVTSISLDAHKYGYAPKGTSIILYRDKELRKRQFFIHADWPGGIFASTTFMGTKSGGPVAGCWAIMNHLGREGYRTIAGEVMKTTRRIKAGIKAFETLRIISDPEMSVLAFTSSQGNIAQIGDALESKGWHLDRLQFPDALHLTITQLNIGMEDAFLKDLAEALENEPLLRKGRRAVHGSATLAGGMNRILPGTLMDKLARKAGNLMGGQGNGIQVPPSALYGISASFRNRRDLKKLVENLLDGMY